MSYALQHRSISSAFSTLTKRYEAWLKQNNDSDWSITRLTDAQKLSLIAIGSSTIIIAWGWRGFCPIWVGTQKGYDLVRLKDGGNVRKKDFELAKKEGYLSRSEAKEIEKLRRKMNHTPTAYKYVWRNRDDEYVGDEDDKDIKDENKYELVLAVWIERRMWLRLLLSFKRIIVLFHECGHAVAGILTGGKVLYISIDHQEGGVTRFKTVWKGRTVKQPNPSVTLPAGYVTSCVIGSFFLFMGFDARMAKIAFVSLQLFITVCALICLSVMPKFAVHHHRHWFRMHAARLLGNRNKLLIHEKRLYQRIEDERREFGNWRDMKDDRYGSSPRDRMVSLDIILLDDLHVSVWAMFAWFYKDSAYLRFFILGLGTMSSLYSLWDVILDGFIHGKDTGSDATEMTSWRNRHKKPDSRIPVWQYSIRWFVPMVSIVVAVIFGGLWAFRTTTAVQLEQAADLAIAGHNGTIHPFNESGSDISPRHVS